MTIRALLVALLLLFPSVAMARESSAPKPVVPAPTCGKTVKECQKKLDEANAFLAAANKRIVAYGQLLTEANDRLVAAVAK